MEYEHERLWWKSLKEDMKRCNNMTELKYDPNCVIRRWCNSHRICVEDCTMCWHNKDFDGQLVSSLIGRGSP